MAVKGTQGAARAGSSVSTKAAPSVYALTGSDRFLRTEALQVLQKQLGVEEGLESVRVDGDTVELADVLDEVRTPSLLGPARVVIVDDADDFISKNRATLEKFCADRNHAGKLVLLCDSMPKNTRLHKVIAECGEVIDCAPPSGRAILGWIVQRAKKTYGKSIDERAAQRLKDHVGDAPGWLDSELAKLAAYVGDRAEIGWKDIEEVTGELREEKVFGVIDAMAVGDTVTALRLWDQVWATDRAAPARWG